jgi:CBS domain-containing protein
MFVENMLSAAVKRLVSVGEDAALIDAAKPLSDFNVDLVVVCSVDGRLAGIITKTDVVRQFCRGSGYTTAASDVMMRNVILCYPSDPLRHVWAVMKERGVKNIPVISQDSRPIGVLNARDVIEVLMDEADYEDALLRDYVMTVGYH